MPPNRFICRAATSWPGCVGQARVVDLGDGRVTGRGSSTTRSALSQWRSIRTPSVFSPRSTSQASNGPATAPIAFWWKATCSAISRSRTTSAPPTTSEWPPAYLVVECTHHVRAEGQRRLEVRRGEGVVDHQQRPGVVRDRRERLDVADVEQRVGGGLHPDQPGLAGPDGGARPRRGRTPAPGRALSPQAVATLSNSRNVPPYASSGSTTWSPGRHSARITVSSAASPLANANPRSPSSRAAMLPSRAVRVGLAERLYS